MDWDEYRILFETEALRQGRSPFFVAKCLAYAEPLAKAGLPVIYDVAHLAAEVEIDEARLRELMVRPASAYVQYQIPKYAGGLRRIREPVWPLTKIQRWILRNILDKQLCHQAATAFIRRRSVKINAEFHVGQTMVLSLDVKDFFESIKRAQISRVFREMKYSDEVADALTRLTIFGGGLPQGASTSPSLSNLVMRTVDEELFDFSKRLAIHYSRYADDLTFSGRFRPGRVVAKVRRILERAGLELNEGKTRLMLTHQRQEVTGIVVNKYLQTPRELRRKLRQELYYIERYGLEEHCSRSTSLYGERLNHLRGVAEFVAFINPEDRDAKNAFKLLGRIRAIERPPR